MATRNSRVTIDWKDLRGSRSPCLMLIALPDNQVDRYFTELVRPHGMTGDTWTRAVDLRWKTRHFKDGGDA